MPRIGLIGYGRRGNVLCGLLRALPDVALVAVGDVEAAARERAAGELGVPVFHPWSEGWPVPVPDVVLVATPPQQRAGLVARVVVPGVKAVLLEKPVALTLGEFDRIDRVCGAVGAVASVAHHWRFCPALRRLKEIVDAGRLGTVESVYATGYGNLLDQGCHLLDAIRWLLGRPTVQWAAAHGTNDREVLARLGGAAAVQIDPHHPAPAWTSAELELTGDVRVRLETGPLLPRTNAPLGDWHERRFRIQGSLGSAECRPGHYLRLQIPGDDEADLLLHPSSLDAATVQLLQAVCDTARTVAPAPVPLSETRGTLEGLLLCGVSLRDNTAAMAPLDARANPFAEISQQRRFAAERIVPIHLRSAARSFSVLIPLLEERGFGERCLQGWLAQAGLPAEAFELVILDDEANPDLTRRLRAQLRSHDRWLSSAGAGRAELYALGAREAQGLYLFFTESHCIPDTDCLREMDRYLREHAVDGACCRSVPVCYNALARADAAQFELGFRQFRREADWRKVNIHGFALRRDVYQLVGGFQDRYDQYAEMVLAAELRDAGARLGYAAGAAVQHHYRVAIHEIAACADGFVRGELQYLSEHGTTDRIGFSYLEMCAATVESRAAGTECRRHEWQQLRRRVLRGDFSAWPLFWVLGRAMLQEGWLGDAWARYELWRSRWACWRARHDDDLLQAAHARLFAAAVRDAWRRLRHTIARPAPVRSEFDCGPDQLPADWLYGFYPLEAIEGRHFRWTRPAAGIDLPIPPGDYEIVIDTGCLRPWPASLRWTLCGRPIPDADIHRAADRCHLRIKAPPLPPGMRRTLGWSCLPWDVPSPRPLGLPVFRVMCRPCGGATAAGAAAAECNHEWPATTRAA